MAVMLALSLPFSVWAQGLFQRGDGDIEQNSGLLRNGEASVMMTNQAFGNPNGSDLTNQTFGNSAPIGSGLLVMLLAGAGYAAMKTKKKNKK
jgi:hypothetical protein